MTDSETLLGYLNRPSHEEMRQKQAERFANPCWTEAYWTDYSELKERELHCQCFHWSWDEYINAIDWPAHP